MKKYETVIILTPNLTKGKINETFDNVENKIKEYAKITQKDDLGVKKLAYEINKNKEGHYVVYQFEIKGNIKENAVKEIERFYRITDEIIKFITVEI